MSDYYEVTDTALLTKLTDDWGYIELPSQAGPGGKAYLVCEDRGIMVELNKTHSNFDESNCSELDLAGTTTDKPKKKLPSGPMVIPPMA